MSLLHGIPVVLHVKTKTGVNAFNEPIYTESKVTVQNVLVGEPSTEEITDTMNLYGKELLYTLGIPKIDANDWSDTVVEFFGKKFRTIGSPTQGIDAMIPLEWNKKVRVVRYEHQDEDRVELGGYTGDASQP